MKRNSLVFNLMSCLKGAKKAICYDFLTDTPAGDDRAVAMDRTRKGIFRRLT